MKTVMYVHIETEKGRVLALADEAGDRKWHLPRVQMESAEPTSESEYWDLQSRLMVQALLDLQSLGVTAEAQTSDIELDRELSSEERLVFMLQARRTNRRKPAAKTATVRAAWVPTAKLGSSIGGGQ